MTFDLKRARELVWAVSERKIWTLLERTGYGGDIDKRGERQAITEICDKQFPSAIAEIERLRAIIDTPSEEPEWVVDFKKLNRFAGAGYSLIDIEIAKKWHTAYRKAQNSNLLRKQEIERLRAALDESERVVAHKTKSAAHWYDEHLQARADRVQTRRVVEQQAARIKALKADLEQSERVIEARLDVIDQQAAKIRELEDVHKRSGVKYAKIINELRSSVYANIPGLKKQWDEILNAPANGKIGPDADAKPHCWQITEERKAAIKELSELLTAIGCPSCHYYIQKNYGENITVLRAMLTEAE